jgi:D-3-phosphoglycerate dehydrogenase
MNVLIADTLAPSAVRRLSDLGFEVSNRPDLSSDDLPKEIAKTDVLIVRSTRVTKDTFAAAPNLALVVRAGAGVNTIDLEAAGSSGVYVANCPGKNADAVAELAIGLLISADRRIPAATAALASGKWRKKEFQKATGLKGRTLGILGFGTIGRATAERAKALGMRILVWSRSMTGERAESAGVDFAATPLSLAQDSDAVSVHLAGTAETRHLVDSSFFQAMREGAILVNTSRGDVVDTAALRSAVEARGLRVAMDVYENEPGSGTADFAAGDLIQLLAAATPHIGASTAQASEAIADEAVRVVQAFKETGLPVNAVNVDLADTATHVLVVRHLNRVGVLAGVLDALREDNVNVDEMHNTIFAGGHAASCTLRLDTRPSNDALIRIRSVEEVLMARLESISPD